MFQIGQALAMVTRGHRKQRDSAWIERLPRALPNQLRRGFVMLFAAGADRPADVVKAAGGFEYQTVLGAKLMQFLELIEKQEREFCNMEDMLRLGFPFIHETEKFL